ncbi:MAG: peptidoglycan DD-metalloendopeptidase family protein [Candidatus Binataceae bacterium]
MNGTLPSAYATLQFSLALFLAIAAGGCFGPPVPQRAQSAQRLTHTVIPGETIYHIAREYGVSGERLMTLNRISDPRDLRVGQTLIIPGHGFAAASAFGIPGEWSVPRASRQFGWPITAGVVSSPFGMRHGVMHDGVDIAAPVGTPVLAADDGVVIYSGHLRGYGNVIIIRHSENYVTVYGHNSVDLIREGARVSRGQEIGEVGETGRATGPNLHFEVRYKNHAQNPLAFLPTPEPQNHISFARNGGS